MDDVGSAESAIVEGRNPVIWIAGCPPPFGDAEAGSHLFADTQQALFRSRGYTDDLLYRFVSSGAKCGSNIDQAAELSDFVDNVRATTHASRVDLVAHSMGSLTARLYLAQGGDKNVRDFVSIASGSHGSFVAGVWALWQAQVGYPAYEGLKEMFPPYACEGQVAGGGADVQAEINGCLTPLGRTVTVDETPGHVHYLSIWNTIDEQVIPRQAACLNQGFQNDCSDPVNVAITVGPTPGPCQGGICPGHAAATYNPAVMEMVYNHVQAPDDDE